MTTQQIVDLLNEINALDPDCLGPLIRNRLPCNEAVADHPTVVVDDPETGKFTVGLLGILEGIAGIDGELIGAAFETDADGNETGRLIGFGVVPFEQFTREPVRHVPPTSAVVIRKDGTIVTELQEPNPES